MKVKWTVVAHASLKDIHRYIAQGSPTYAQRMVDRITRRSEQIALFPESGRMVPDYDNPRIRELIEGPYRVLYWLKDDHIEIINVIHGAMQLPE